MTTITGATGNEIHYETAGAGRPVVLIHGWPLNGDSWEPQRRPLVDAGFQVVTYDRRGFGQSAKPGSGYDYDTFAQDLDALMTALDLRDVTLVGFSMGGGEVARYVGRYGTDRLRSVVFAAAVPPYLLKTDDNPDGGLGEDDVTGMKDGLAKDREGFLQDFLTTFFTADGTVAVGEEVVQTALAQAAQADLDAALACIDQFSRTDFRRDLEAVDVPTLVIHGDADAIVPFEVSGKRTAATVEGSELTVIAGGPHGLNASHTDRFNEALLAFL
ncbi:alpha/beta fold hydrolase [Luteipulveratus flavus]|uniref:Alpha/beta hydrolase n=1 Tax=Luteipulveratus flavus TaxID=3031728 RepID=A0ABT6CC60_9MICO|nr:alpha/beta hydrolase [Luteipulveratus sp. YIM 133296]MDF8265952.1 alpha/beta hydrolase [Luteipulveratus sp. YIM 133296]